jgi:hypothetical protein
MGLAVDGAEHMGSSHDQRSDLVADRGQQLFDSGVVPREEKMDARALDCLRTPHRTNFRFFKARATH